MEKRLQQGEFFVPNWVDVKVQVLRSNGERTPGILTGKAYAMTTKTNEDHDLVKNHYLTDIYYLVAEASVDNKANVKRVAFESLREDNPRLLEPRLSLLKTVAEASIKKNQPFITSVLPVLQREVSGVWRDKEREEEEEKSLPARKKHKADKAPPEEERKAKVAKGKGKEKKERKEKKDEPELPAELDLLVADYLNPEDIENYKHTKEGKRMDDRVGAACGNCEDLIARIRTADGERKQRLLNLCLPRCIPRCQRAWAKVRENQKAHPNKEMLGDFQIQLQFPSDLLPNITRMEIMITPTGGVMLQLYSTEKGVDISPNHKNFNPKLHANEKELFRVWDGLSFNYTESRMAGRGITLKTWAHGGRPLTDHEITALMCRLTLFANKHHGTVWQVWYYNEKNDAKKWKESLDMFTAVQRAIDTMNDSRLQVMRRSKFSGIKTAALQKLGIDAVTVK